MKQQTEVLEDFDIQIDNTSVIEKRSKVDPYVFTPTGLYSAGIEELYVASFVFESLEKLEKIIAKTYDEDVNIDIDSSISDALIKEVTEFAEDMLKSRFEISKKPSNDVVKFRSEYTFKDEHICLKITRNIGREKRVLKEIKIPVKTETSEICHYTIHDMTGKEHKFSKCLNDENVNIEISLDNHNFNFRKCGLRTDVIHFSSIHIDRDRTVTYFIKKQ